MKCFYLLESAAVVGLVLLGGTAGFAKGGGHSHGGHSHSSHSHGSGSHHSSHHASAHHSSPHPAAHAFVGGHSTVNHGGSHNGHHHGWGNGYWSNGYWYGSGDGYVAPVAIEPSYHDQYWSVAPTPLVTPATGEIVTNEYLNVTPPVGPPPSPSGPVETCPTAPSDGQ